MEIKKETEKIGQAFVTGINTSLSESMSLQKVVDQTVIFELQNKGYSKQEAEQMLKDYNAKQKKVSP